MLTAIICMLSSLNKTRDITDKQCCYVELYSGPKRPIPKKK